MLFNYSKCKSGYFGYGNEIYDYYLRGNLIESAEEEKDLRIVITRNLKSSVHCALAAKKANRVLGTIKKKFKNRKKGIIVVTHTPYIIYVIE